MKLKRTATLALGLLFLFFLSSCNRKPSLPPPSGMTPEETVTQYMEYWKENDYDGMNALTSEPLHLSSKGQENVKSLTYQIVRSDINDDIEGYLAEIEEDNNMDPKKAGDSGFWFDPPVSIAYVSIEGELVNRGSSKPAELYWTFILEKETGDSDWVITAYGAG